MADSFDAYVIDRNEADKTQTGGWRRYALADLMEGDVTLRVRHTTMNYKDALAITGKSPVVRRFPMIPGIDLAAEVVTSADPAFQRGDGVILNGWGVGETHMGGYAGMARVKGAWLLKRPGGLSGADCMAIGTAGYTAALCALRLAELGITPDRGPILVTGASGGVGSYAVSLLAAMGHHVIAATGRPSEEQYLRRLGAREVIDRAEFAAPGRPLGKERFAGAVDAVGSQTLANVLSQIAYGGAVAACGLAQGHDLPTTVMPFILRSVTLAGVDSVMAPRDGRQAAWALIARHLDRDLLAEITTEVSRHDIDRLAPELLAGKVRGRVLIPMG